MTSHRTNSPKLVGLAGLLLVLVAMPAPASVQGTFQRTFTVSGPVNLEVYTRSGDVTVRAGSSGSVSITGRIHVSDRWLEGNRAADVKQIENDPPVHQNGNTVRVDYVNYRNISIDYEITAPANTELRTKSGSGDLTIEGLQGNIDLQTGSGDMRLARLNGDMHIETGSGNVRASQVAGPLRARAGSGDIQIEETAAGDLDIHTGSGNIGVRGVNGGFRAEAGSGDITIEGVSKNGWNVRTGSGNVRLRLPSDAAYDIDLATSSGTITMNQPVTTTVVGRVQEARRSISGKVHGGGPVVAVRTGSGDIHVE
jgi:DUF4097 and DUF4098 domain-containing protein YvlB